MRIEEVNGKVAAFLSTMFSVENKRIFGITKTNDGWEARAEIIEESQLIRALGKYPPVYDRNTYRVTLSESGEVLGVDKETPGEESREAS